MGCTHGYVLDEAVWTTVGEDELIWRQGLRGRVMSRKGSRKPLNGWAEDTIIQTDNVAIETPSVSPTIDPDTNSIQPNLQEPKPEEFHTQLQRLLEQKDEELQQLRMQVRMSEPNNEHYIHTETTTVFMSSQEIIRDSPTMSNNQNYNFVSPADLPNNLSIQRNHNMFPNTNPTFEAPFYYDNQIQPVIHENNINDFYNIPTRSSSFQSASTTTTYTASSRSIFSGLRSRFVSLHSNEVTANEWMELERMVSSYLRPSTGGVNISLNTVEMLHIPKLWECFESQRSLLVEPNIVKRKCYGPTPELNQVAEHGFEIYNHDIHKTGIYFPDFTVVQGVSQTLEILICDVAVGRAWKYDKRSRNLDLGRVQAAGFDSVHTSATQGVSGYIIFHPHQIIPRFRTVVTIDFHLPAPSSYTPMRNPKEEVLYKNEDDTNEMAPAPNNNNIPTSSTPNNDTSSSNNTAFINMEELEEEASCAICTELLMEAMTLECSHTFCSDCLDRWMKQQQVCPVCRLNVKMKKAVRNRALDNMVEKLLDKLPNSSRLKTDRQKRYAELEKSKKTSKQEEEANVWLNQESIRAVNLEAPPAYPPLPPPLPTVSNLWRPSSSGLAAANSTMNIAPFPIDPYPYPNIPNNNPTFRPLAPPPPYMPLPNNSISRGLSLPNYYNRNLFPTPSSQSLNSHIGGLSARRLGSARPYISVDESSSFISSPSSSITRRSTLS